MGKDYMKTQRTEYQHFQRKDIDTIISLMSDIQELVSRNENAVRLLNDIKLILMNEAFFEYDGLSVRIRREKDLVCLTCSDCGHIFVRYQDQNFTCSRCGSTSTKVGD